MTGIQATYRNGRVELSEKVNWPDGTQLRVLPCGNGDTSMRQWPDGFFDQLRADWGNEPFERPPQGESEQREEW